MSFSQKYEGRIRRHRRVRAKISGTSDQPRLVVFRSSQHVYAQLVDDETGRTILVVSDLKLPKAKKGKDQVEIAEQVGELLAKQAMEKEIKTIVFDRGGFAYHGRVKAVADGARKAGLQF